MFLEPMPPSVLLFWITGWHLRLFLITSLIVYREYHCRLLPHRKGYYNVNFVTLIIEYLGLIGVIFFSKIPLR